MKCDRNVISTQPESVYAQLFELLLAVLVGSSFSLCRECFVKLLRYSTRQLKLRDALVKAHSEVDTSVRRVIT